LGDELRALFRDLFDPKSEEKALAEMERIRNIAHQIGGSIKDQAEQLRADVFKFLLDPNDPKLLALMKAHALRLGQEMREI